MTNKVLGYRKMINFSQREMATKLGISEGQYREKEKGRYDFSQSEMKKFYETVQPFLSKVKLEDIFF